MSLPRLQHLESLDPRLPLFRKRSLNLLYIAGGLSVVSVFALGVFGIVFAIFALGYVLVTAMLNIYHRMQIENFYHYREIEALLSLHALIPIRHPLPPMRLWAIAPDFATLIAATIWQYKPRMVVELGSGVSTVIVSYGLEKLGRGTVTSFEHLDEFVGMSRRMLVQHQLESYATIIYAPLSSLGMQSPWYDQEQMKSLGSIDLLIVDGPPETTGRLARYPAIPVLYDQLADGALILVDDYMRSDEHEMVNRWLTEFGLEVVDAVANEKGAAILRKVGRHPDSAQFSADSEQMS